MCRVVQVVFVFVVIVVYVVVVAYPMTYVGNATWSATLKLSASEELCYRYEVRYGDSVIRKEWCDKHRLVIDKKAANIRIIDRWADMPEDRSFHSSMFTDGVFARPARKKAQAVANDTLTIRADVASVRSNQSLVLVVLTDFTSGIARPTDNAAAKITNNQKKKKY